ncbi:MAG: sugar phosphate isomerase/epimerase [Planctomycetota bacterium]|nr:MAG: sugar phosphate isomerase/epimerase [Planctomycetota bacterium]
MFVAISTRSLSDLPFEEALAQITDLGFDRVDLWVDDQGTLLKTAEIAADPDGFATRFRDRTRLLPTAITLAHDVPPDVFSRLVTAAKNLKITQITLPASEIGTPFNAEIERLQELARRASADGVRLAIRNATGALTADPHTAVELCQAVSGLGLALDPTYVLQDEAPERSMDLMIPHAIHVLLRDSTADSVQVQVGLGEVEYGRLVSQLSRHNYNRALSIELFPDLMGGVDRQLELRKMRMLLESLL